MANVKVFLQVSSPDIRLGSLKMPGIQKKNVLIFSGFLHFVITAFVNVIPLLDCLSNGTFITWSDNDQCISANFDFPVFVQL